ncbi:probable L-type lectin-domain containing receptor kinase VI.1 [Impatiens glandulifera]|uniref:probable L-type lectin-domain containing receptor kinase VI.1 n=1 Tax=Impatiens glandulifera TaxID=253017 RepID=UPI001FB0DDB9|nr:probable L-type lectin-domain containing receptor kinase VI.1 [Impatiens glandulifera]
MSEFSRASISILLLPLFIQLANSIDFSYTGFNNQNLTLGDGATILPTGALKLTNETKNIMGHAFYPRPFQFIISPTNISSFSTHFIFAIVSPIPNNGGHGLAFTLSPSTTFPGAQPDHFLGILNSTNNGLDSNHIFAVEFDTVNGHNEGLNTDGNHVGININSMDSNATEPASYYVNDTEKKEEVNLETGDPIQAWIDYDGFTKLLNVTISPLNIPKPIRPLISQVMDLPAKLLDKMYVGFSAATGEKTSSHYILGWSFSSEGMADSIDVTQLPPVPEASKRRRRSFSRMVVGLVCSLIGLVIVLCWVLIYLAVYRRKKEYSERVEDWELDYPHRIQYKDLYKATQGFKESELIGNGGFGAVYKGVLPSNGSEVAVKRLINNSIQGMREFAAEIESLGRLRHKNLVNLQGWCKKKNELLLVYDYVPKGGLDSLLLRPRDGSILSWDQRFRIIKDVAAGILYLHEEWDKVVIHRDVKSSNVLVDSEMTARLGDFGLARLYDHGQNSHNTKVVGTIGYIAPELAKTGESSTRSDVFAFGVLLLELICGRGSIVYVPGLDRMMLLDWVIEWLKVIDNEIVDIVDPRLEGVFVVEEVAMVLRVGLVCSHTLAELRPSMRQVTRYLDGDESMIPEMDEKLDSAICGHTNGSLSSSLAGTSSNKLSSFGAMTYSSQEMGR